LDESNSRKKTHLQSIGWSTSPDSWISSYTSLYRSLVRSTMQLNLQDERPQISNDRPGPTFDFPVFVMNLPRRHDRRRNLEVLLRSLGFSQIIFPNVTLASEIDVAALVENGFVQQKAVDAILAGRDKGPSALPAYLANALDQVGLMSLDSAMLLSHHINGLTSTLEMHFREPGRHDPRRRLAAAGAVRHHGGRPDAGRRHRGGGAGREGIPPGHVCVSNQETGLFHSWSELH
jgi:hypothetical protein